LAAKEEAATWARRADQRDTKPDVVAARRAGGLDLAVAWASMGLKLDASLHHLPPTSMPKTTKRHRPLRMYLAGCLRGYLVAYNFSTNNKTNTIQNRKIKFHIQNITKKNSILFQNLYRPPKMRF